MKWNVIHKAASASTNIDARSGRPGDVFTADWQSAGRGRLDHKWHSPRGVNLIMSAVIDVSGLESAHVATLPIAIGLAVCRAAKDLGVYDTMIKWPNDILVNDRKLAGILCELNGALAIVGIGMNVNCRDFPGDIAQRATSLLLETGLRRDVAGVRDAVLDQISSILPVWEEKGLEALWEALVPLDCLRGRQVRVLRIDSDPTPLEGLCGGIAPDGSLLVAGEHIWAGEATIGS